MSVDKSVAFLGLVPNETAAPVFAKALGIYVGAGRQYTFKELARGVRISPDRLTAFLLPPGHANHRQPKLSDILSLGRFLGSEFTSDVLFPAGLGAFDLPDPEPGHLARIAPEAVEDAASLTKAAVSRDNVVPLDRVGSRMMARGAQLMAMHGAGQGDLFSRERAA